MGLNDLLQIGDRIKKHRKQMGITQKEMAQQLNIPYSTYSNYENNNRTPDIRTLQMIADKLDISILSLVGFNTSTPIQSEQEYQELLSLKAILENMKAEAQIDLEFINNYRILNKSGKEKVTSYIKDLCKIPEYQDQEKMEILDKEMQTSSNESEKSIVASFEKISDANWNQLISNVQEFIKTHGNTDKAPAD